jgi:hypothetical protein
MTTTFRRIYVILGVAAVATFFGHAMWAVRGKDSFVELVTGSFDNLLGISVGIGTATNLVKAIGYWDIGLSVVMAVAVIGVLQKPGPLHRFALSPLMLGVWVWAIFWGFATGASRMSGAGVWYSRGVGPRRARAELPRSRRARRDDVVPPPPGAP